MTPRMSFHVSSRRMGTPPPGGHLPLPAIHRQHCFTSKMPDSCCSVGCANRRGDKSGLSFYRIPSENENPERRRLWICAIRRAAVPCKNEIAKDWVPSKYTRLCSQHFITGAKSDDPLSHDWVPSIFSHTTATKKRKKEHDMGRYEQHSRMQNRRVEEQKKQDAMEALLTLTSVPEAEPAPHAEEELQQCDDKSCKAMIESLQRECNGLRDENRRLNDIIKSITFDELAFEKSSSPAGMSLFLKV